MPSKQSQYQFAYVIVRFQQKPSAARFSRLQPPICNFHSQCAYRLQTMLASHREAFFHIACFMVVLRQLLNNH